MGRKPNPTFGANEVANLCQTNAKRIREYSKTFEELGYRFKRKAGTDYRIYTEKEADLIGRAINIQTNEKIGVLKACQWVLAGKDRVVDGEEVVIPPAITNSDLVAEMKGMISEFANKEDIIRITALINELVERDNEQRDIIKQQAAVIEEFKKQQPLMLGNFQEQQARLEESHNKMMNEVLTEKNTVIKEKDVVINKLKQHSNETNQQMQQMSQQLNKALKEREFYQSESQQYLTIINDINRNIDGLKQRIKQQEEEQKKKRWWRLGL